MNSLSLSLSLSLSRCVNGHFPGEPGLAGFIAAKDDVSGGNNWSRKLCKSPVKSSPPTNQHPVFYRPDAHPVAQPTVSKHRMESFYEPGYIIGVLICYVVGLPG